METIKEEGQGTVIEMNSAGETITRTTRRKFKVPLIGGRSKKPKKAPKPGGQMTFFEHLGELRNRLIWSCLAVIIGSIVGFIFSRNLVGLFVRLAQPYELVTLTAFDQFGVYMNIAIYCGLLLASPFLVYQILAFLAPALDPESDLGTPEYDQEVRTLKSVKRSLWFFIPFISISFIIGIAFAYFLVIPSAYHFLLNFSEGQLKPILDAKKFMNDTTKILFWSGVVFEVPIILFVMTKIRLITFKRLLNWWKWALVLSLVAAAFITPSPDVVSQAVIAIPVFGLYWLGVLLARFA